MECEDRWGEEPQVQLVPLKRRKPRITFQEKNTASPSREKPAGQKAAQSVKQDWAEVEQMETLRVSSCSHQVPKTGSIE